MKKYRKNTRTVEAVQYRDTPTSLKNIKKLLKDTCARCVMGGDDNRVKTPRFTLFGETRHHIIYKTNWIVKDDKYYFVVSDDVFKDMYAEVK